MTESYIFLIPNRLNFQGSWLYQSTQVMTHIKTAQLRQRLKELNGNKEHQKAE